MRNTLYIVALAAAMLADGARAQEIRGRVTDAEGRAVEPATVAVFRGDRQLAADVTDTAGRFRLSAPDGPYTLRVRHVAYRPLDTLISVRSRSGDELSLVMAEASVGLGEVTVQAERIVREADRFVVHVGDAPAMAGRDGAELLRTAPGVWVTDDGVSVNGAAGARVYVDDRELRLSGRALTAYLRTLRAADVARVEVLPQADASYGADVRGGVVRIVLRRRRERGMDANVSVEADFGRQYGGVRPSASVRAHAGHWTWHASIASDPIYKGIRRQSAERFYVNREAGSFVSQSVANGRRRSVTGRVGAIFDANPRTSIGAEAELSRGRETEPSEVETRINQHGQLRSITGHYDREETDRLAAAAVNVTHRTDTIGSRLKLVADYTDRSLGGETDEHSTAGWTNRDLTASRYRVLAIDASAVRVFRSGMRLSTGAKYTRNRMRDSVRREGAASDPGFLTDYTEQIAAGYASVALELGRLSLTAGLRAEWTYTAGREGMRRAYADLFENATATYAFDPMRLFMLVAQYARNVERPNFRYLNPRRVRSSDFAYIEGNPALRPTYIRRLSLTAVWHYRYTLTVGGNLHRDLVREEAHTDASAPEVRIVRPENHDRENHWFVALSAPLRPMRGWELNANLVGVRQDLRRASSDPWATHWLGFARLTLGVTLPRDAYAELTYNASSRLHSANSGIEPRHTFDVALKKQFADRRLTVTLGVSNIFDRGVTYFSHTERFDERTSVSGGSAGRRVTVGLHYVLRSGKSVKSRTVERASTDDTRRMDRVKNEK